MSVLLPDTGRAVLVAGMPRSGTTWVGRVLASSRGAVYLHEPDNEKLSAFALRAKRSVGRFPVLGPSDEPPVDYVRLWDAALAGIRRTRSRRDELAHRLLVGSSPKELEQAVSSAMDNASPRLRLAVALAHNPMCPEPAPQPVVKSVHLPLALDWVGSRWRPRVLVVLRHPLDVLASLTEMALPDQSRRLDDHPEVRRRYLDRWNVSTPPANASALARAAWQVGLMTCALEEHVRDFPETTVVTHESLCADPEAGFSALFATLGLAWTKEASQFLDASDQPGTGYETRRISRAQPGRWRERMTEAQLHEIIVALNPFPLKTWSLPAEG